MGRYRVYVYAISKNEAAFAHRWVKNMSEADGIYLLDTGSSDGTPDIMRSLGVHVECAEISPWRFDTARNRSLSLVPEDADLCVCTDIDEVFHPGWREGMERALDMGAQRVRYRYTWNFNPDGSEGVVFFSDKAHARHGFHWIHPVHEVLVCHDSHKTVTAPGVQLDHHADNSKSRAQYLPLLELAVEEDPMNDRNMHYLGREYMFHSMWEKCEKTLKKHLALPSAVWPDERCASMRYIARACLAGGKITEAQNWLMRAAAEAPHLREPWLELSELESSRENWALALGYAQKALTIKSRSQTYINEASSWGSRPYDLAAIAAYYLGLYGLAADYGHSALEISPQDERLRSNMEFYRAKI